MRDELQDLLGYAKRQLKKTGEVPPTFIVGNSVIGMPFRNEQEKKKAEKVLNMIVQRSNLDKYFSVFIGNRIDTSEVESKIKSDFRDLPDNPTAEEFKDFLQGAMSMTENPNQNPMKEEVLIVSRYHKTEGTDTVIVPVEEESGAITFGKEEEAPSTGYVKWNIWHNKQIDLNELKDKADEFDKGDEDET